MEKIRQVLLRVRQNIGVGCCHKSSEKGNVKRKRAVIWQK
jgi:hypothetical protein